MRPFHCLLPTTALLLGLLAISLQPLRAQDTSARPRFLIGAIAGYNGVAYNSSAFGAPGTVPGFENFENGSAGTQFIGMSALFPLLAGNQLFLVTELAFDDNSASFSSMSGTSFKTGTFSYDAIFTDLDYALLNIGVKFNLFRVIGSDSTLPTGLGLQTCASLGKTTASTFSSTIYKTWDTSGRILANAPETTLTQIDGIQAFRFAIRLEVTWDLPVFSRWIITPYVGADVPLTRVDNTTRNWYDRTAYFALALRYCVY